MKKFSLFSFFLICFSSNAFTHSMSILPITDSLKFMVQSAFVGIGCHVLIKTLLNAKGSKYKTFKQWTSSTLYDGLIFFYTKNASLYHWHSAQVGQVLFDYCKNRKNSSFIIGSVKQIVFLMTDLLVNRFTKNEFFTSSPYALAAAVSIFLHNYYDLKKFHEDLLKEDLRAVSQLSIIEEAKKLENAKNENFLQLQSKYDESQQQIILKDSRIKELENQRIEDKNSIEELKNRVIQSFEKAPNSKVIKYINDESVLHSNIQIKNSTKKSVTLSSDQYNKMQKLIELQSRTIEDLKVNNAITREILHSILLEENNFKSKEEKDKINLVRNLLEKNQMFQIFN